MVKSFKLDQKITNWLKIQINLKVLEILKKDRLKLSKLLKKSKLVRIFKITQKIKIACSVFWCFSFLVFFTFLLLKVKLQKETPNIHFSTLNLFLLLCYFNSIISKNNVLIYFGAFPTKIRILYLWDSFVKK